MPEQPGHRLITHSFLNALGQGVPIAAAVVAVPLLVRELGAEKFGLLTLAWSIIGYASLFDFGVGRALTQLVAERRYRVLDREIAAIVWSALFALVGIGLGMGAIGFLSSPWAAHRGLTITAPVQSDALLAFRLLALGIPFVVVNTGVRGALEAYERFDLVNAVRVPLGISMFVGPLLVLPFSHSLAAAVCAVLVARVIAVIAQAFMMLRVLPAMRGRPTFSVDVLRPIARFGAWMTVSNVLSPLMTQADRFLIGSVLSASVVAYYTAPYEMVTRLMALVALAVATSLFPAFARWRERDHARALFSRGMRLTAAALVPTMLAIIAFAHPILRLWLGAEFASQSTAVLQILGAGVICNGLAQIPFAHIQAIGRADLTAKIHILEVPLYLVLALYLIRTQGISGAAIAWSVRMLVDAVLLFAVSRRLLANAGDMAPSTEAARA